MKMATKLTKAFAAFVGDRGFEIANEDEISQRPGEDYKLAWQIFREPTGAGLIATVESHNRR